jgi:glycosyltransferase involved in cell wall biosynthesis
MIKPHLHNNLCEHKKMINILFITYTHSMGGGAENVLTNLVNHLDQDRYKIGIIETRHFSVKKEPIADAISLLHPFAYEKEHLALDAIKYILSKKPEIIKTLFKLYNYDVVISWNYQVPSFCLAAFDKEVKIAWFHGDIYDLSPVESGEKDERIEECRQAQYKAWEKADKIVTISKESLQSLKDVFPSLFEKGMIVHNGYDFEKIYLLAKETNGGGVPSGFFNFNTNIILAVGRLDDNKNFELLIRSVSKVIHSGGGSLVIVGHGPLKEKLERITEEEGIRERVFFVGYQANPYPLFVASKIVCVTSLSEGFSTVTIESMALGKPFITTPVAGADELACNGECGLVADWNVDAYSDCIKKLLTDDILYEKMSKRCLEEAKKYDIDNAVKQFDDLINGFSPRLGCKEPKIPQRLKQVHAVIYFAYAFASKKYIPVRFAFKRFKKSRKAIDLIKVLYHTIRIFWEMLCFPIVFIIGVCKGVTFSSTCRS